MSNERKILIVDDNEDFLENLRTIFDGAGYRVETAFSADNALTKIDSEFKLIITDFRMPGMDGLSFLKAVKLRYQKIPVILITGYPSPDLISEALRNGVINFFEKPFSALDLLAYAETVITQFNSTKDIPDNIKQLLLYCSRAVTLESNEKILDWVPNLIVKDLLSFGFSKEDELLGLSTALIEAVANSLYHGNFEIKSDVRNDGSLEGQKQFKNLVAQREKDPLYSQRKIAISYCCDSEKIKVTVADEGAGFDWRKYLGKGFSLYSGKGLFLINSLVDKAEYNEKGNEVTLIKFLQK